MPRPLRATTRDVWTPHTSLERALLIAAAALPAALIAVCIAAFSVNTPWLEEWLHISWFQVIAEHRFPWRQMFAQQSEYRQIFPNLILLALGVVGKGDVRLAMIVTFLLACLVSFNVYRLASSRTDGSSGLVQFALANLFIFSPIQYENWLQGQQLIFFIPIVMLLVCLRIASSARPSMEARFVWCALLCTISTFSSANGFLCWLLVLPALVKRLSVDGLSKMTWWITGWIVAFALNLAAYGYGYEKPSYNPPLSFVITHPGSGVLSFLLVVGEPLGLERRWIAAPIGLLLLVTFGWACAECWRRRDAQRAPDLAIAWLIVGSYSLLTAILITVGRAGFGPYATMESRYTTFTLYLPLALIFLVPLCIEAGAGDPTRRTGRRLRPRLTTWLALVLVLYHVPIYLFGIGRMSVWEGKVAASKACVLLINVIRDDCVRLMGGYFHHKFEMVETLERLGFLDRALIRSDNLRDIAGAGWNRGFGHGSFAALVSEGDGRYVASGTATLPQRGDAAHLVLLAYDDGGGGERMFAVTEVPRDATIVSTVRGRRPPDGARWRKVFNAGNLPSPPVRITAWAFDAYTGRAYELDGAHVLPAETERERTQRP